MPVDFTARMIGMFIFALVGARLGVIASSSLGLPELAVSFIFSLVGVLFGLIMTPWLTTRPIRALRRFVTELPMEVLFTSLIGLLIALVIGVLLSVPLALLDPPFGTLLPVIIALVLAYLLTSLGSVRSREVWVFMAEWLGVRPKKLTGAMVGERQLLLDTSVLIDGRIVDIVQTGFVGGTLVVPAFVISELHRVADSSDAQRRNRGRRGLDKLGDLQRDASIAFRIIEDDVEGMTEVDNKLIVLALRLKAPIVTIDYPLNQVAVAQGAEVLNINELANAVRSIYIPGEAFAIRVIQDGNQPGQGVGYLEDGTMVIVENGHEYMDRTIFVEVTKLINRPTGRIIFTQPTKTPSTG